MNDITEELAKLHILNGADFIRQLRLIVSFREFQPVAGEIKIFSAIGQENGDYPALLNAARKAVTYGYTVYILPNPRDIRTADFIFERKGVYKMFDLKTITGQNSVGNRLKESIGQSNRVLLNLCCNYNIRNLTSEILHYFESYSNAQEVLLFSGGRHLSIGRNIAESKGFIRLMMNTFK